MKKIALALAFVMSLSFLGCNHSPAPASSMEKSTNAAVIKKLEGVRKGYGKIFKAALKSSEMDKAAKVADQSNKYMEKLNDIIAEMKSGKIDNKTSAKKLEGVRKGYGKIVKAALKFENMDDAKKVVDASNKYMEKLTDIIESLKK